jgi:sulfur carrier protein
MTVRELLAEMDLLGRKLAVERNGEVVPRSLHAETFLAEGDVVEIVTAVGGG